MLKEALAKQFPPLSKERRAEHDAVIKAVNRDFSTVVVAVRQEFGGIKNWKQFSKSKASVASKIATAIQNVDSASAGVLNMATQTVIQEIYAIEDWPTNKRVVVSRATAAIRRLKPHA